MIDYIITTFKQNVDFEKSGLKYSFLSGQLTCHLKKPCDYGAELKHTNKVIVRMAADRQQIAIENSSQVLQYENQQMHMFHAIWKPRAVCRLHRAVCRLHAMQSADCAATVSMNYMHVCALER